MVCLLYASRSLGPLTPPQEITHACLRKHKKREAEQGRSMCACASPAGTDKRSSCWHGRKRLADVSLCFSVQGSAKAWDPGWLL